MIVPSPDQLLMIWMEMPQSLGLWKVSFDGHGYKHQGVAERRTFGYRLSPGHLCSPCASATSFESNFIEFSFNLNSGNQDLYDVRLWSGMQVSHMTSSPAVLYIQRGRWNEQNECAFHFTCKSTQTTRVYRKRQRKDKSMYQINWTRPNAQNGIQKIQYSIAEKSHPIYPPVKRLAYIISFFFVPIFAFVQISHPRLFRGIYHPFVSILKTSI